MAKCVELKEIDFKMANSSLSPMGKCVELQQTCLKNAICSLRPVAKCRLGGNVVKNLNKMFLRASKGDDALL